MLKYRVAKWPRLLGLGFIVGPTVGGAAYMVAMTLAAALGGRDYGLAAAVNGAALGAAVGLFLGWIPALITLIVCCVMPRDGSFGFLRYFLSSNIAALFVFGRFSPYGNDPVVGYLMIVAASTLAGGLVWGVAKESHLIVPAE